MKNPGEGTVLLIVARPSLNLTQNAEKKHSSIEKRSIGLLKRCQLCTPRCWRMQRYADGIKIRRLQCAMCLQKIDKLISASHIYPPDIVYHITVTK